MRIKLPVTTYYDVDITSEDMVELLEKECKKIAGRWDTIVLRQDGTGYYYDRGYGSHDIGEEDGPDVDEVTLTNYKVVYAALAYYREKVKKERKK